MTYDEDDTTEGGDGGLDEDAPVIAERLSALRAGRSGAGGYSPQARQRIEYLMELRRLRSQAGDDAIDAF